MKVIRYQESVTSRGSRVQSGEELVKTETFMVLKNIRFACTKKKTKTSDVFPVNISGKENNT